MEMKKVKLITALLIISVAVITTVSVAEISPESSERTFNISEESFSLELETVNQTCHGQGALGVNDYNVSENSLVTASFEGSIQTPNPCHTLQAEVAQVEEGRYRLDIQPVSENITCIECVGQVSYRGRFEAETLSQLEIMYEGSSVETVEVEETIGPVPRQNFLTRFMDWFTGLFN